MRIAVTGGAGFIGSHLCHYLLEKGHEVACLDNLSTGAKKSIAPLLDNLNFGFFQCDIREQRKVEQIFREKQIELIYHYAAVVGVKRTLEQPEEVLDVNINGTVNVLESARRCGCHSLCRRAAFPQRHAGSRANARSCSRLDKP